MLATIVCVHSGCETIVRPILPGTIDAGSDTTDSSIGSDGPRDGAADGPQDSGSEGDAPPRVAFNARRLSGGSTLCAISDAALYVHQSRSLWQQVTLPAQEQVKLDGLVFRDVWCEDTQTVQLAAVDQRGDAGINTAMATISLSTGQVTVQSINDFEAKSVDGQGPFAWVAGRPGGTDSAVYSLQSNGSWLRPPGPVVYELGMNAVAFTTNIFTERNETKVFRAAGGNVLSSLSGETDSALDLVRTALPSFGNVTDAWGGFSQVWIVSDKGRLRRRTASSTGNWEFVAELPTMGDAGVPVQLISLASVSASPRRMLTFSPGAVYRYDGTDLQQVTPTGTLPAPIRDAHVSRSRTTLFLAGDPMVQCDLDWQAAEPSITNCIAAFIER